MRPTTEQIGERLAAAFPDARFEVIDESHLHAGHAGAQGGAGHFRVRIASARFEGLAPLARHRLVYDSVRDWMPDRIHALSIDARIPDR
ncbi:MAG TPA: BolA family protein [Burkholderiaceae bacterium]